MDLNFLLNSIFSRTTPQLNSTHLLQPALITFLLLGASYCLYLAVVSWQRRQLTGAKLYSGLMVVIIVYTLGYSLELVSTNLEAMLWCIRLEYLGVANLPAVWLGLGLYYANQSEWMKPRRLLVLWIIPLITIFAVLTNGYHHLFYTASRINLSGQFPTLSFERGPLYWLHMIYSFGSFIGVSLLLASRYRLHHLLYRRQVSLMLAASLSTILITALHLLGITPIPGLDIIPFALIVSSWIIGWGINSYHLLDLTPLARGVLFEHQLDGVVVLDDQGQLIDYNPAAGRILDLPPNAIGRSWLELLSIEAGSVFENLSQKPATFEFSLNHPDTHFFDVSSIPLESRHHQYVGKVVVFHETTHRKEVQMALENLNAELKQRIHQLKSTEQALLASQENYRLLAENSNDVIWTMDLSGHFLYVSPAVERLRGFTPGEVIQQSLEEAVCAGSLPVVREGIQRAIHADQLGQSLPPEYLEIEQPCKGGGSVWTEVTAHLVFSEIGKPTGFVGVSRDIRERKRAEDRLRHDATHDVLTGLPNRFLFLDRLERAIEYTRRITHCPFSVLFLDLDDFKIINDSLGHMVGDQILIAVADRLKSCLRTSDTVARLGGDEFVILLEGIKSLDDVKTTATRIQDQLKFPINLDNRQVFTTASIGIVLSVMGYERPEEVLRDADLAMYRAKALGKARFETFEPNLRKKAISRLDMENDLRQALQDGKFILHYQPIYCLTTDEIMGFEALLRWDHPKRQLVSPAEFIPIAEETGLIVKIGKWVLEEACYQMKKWQGDFPQLPLLKISINISGKQFTQPDFVDQVVDVLQTVGLSPDCLVLEITETVFIDNAPRASAVFTRLCDLGIQIQIDDFGTGYSSLGYIKHFPIHTVKIDRSFIQELGVSRKNSDLVRAIVSMTQDLGMEAIAEGIETEAQLQELKKYDCKYGQGYLLATPLGNKSVEILLEGRQQNKISKEMTTLRSSHGTAA